MDVAVAGDDVTGGQIGRGHFGHVGSRGLTFMLLGTGKWADQRVRTVVHLVEQGMVGRTDRDPAFGKAAPPIVGEGLRDI